MLADHISPRKSPANQNLRIAFNTEKQNAGSNARGFPLIYEKPNSVEIVQVEEESRKVDFKSISLSHACKSMLEDKTFLSCMRVRCH
jgi:hypothetical protein